VNCSWGQREELQEVQELQELQEFRSSGVQEFRSSGVQEFRRQFNGFLQRILASKVKLSSQDSSKKIRFLVFCNS
jgi:hypothetical protein